MSELDQSKVAKILEDINHVESYSIEITHLCVNPKNYYINGITNLNSPLITFEGFFDKPGLNFKIHQ